MNETIGYHRREFPRLTLKMNFNKLYACCKERSIEGLRMWKSCLLLVISPVSGIPRETLGKKETA